jgi:hypothetical protein
MPTAPTFSFDGWLSQMNTDNEPTSHPTQIVVKQCKTETTKCHISVAEKARSKITILQKTPEKENKKRSFGCAFIHKWGV